MLGWCGIVVPTGTPPAIISKLNADFVGALKSQDVSDRMRAAGRELFRSTADEFQQQIKSDYVLWGKVARESGVKVD